MAMKRRKLIGLTNLGNWARKKMKCNAGRDSDSDASGIEVSASGKENVSVQSNSQNK